MDHSENFLLVRADGFAETAEGDIAVTMVAKGQPVAGMEPAVRRVRFSPCPACQTMEVHWGESDPLSIFSAETAAILLRLKLAVHPAADTIRSFNAKVSAMEKKLSKAKPAADHQNIPAGAGSAPEGGQPPQAPTPPSGAAAAAPAAIVPPPSPDGAAGPEART